VTGRPDEDVCAPDLRVMILVFVHPSVNKR